MSPDKTRADGQEAHSHPHAHDDGTEHDHAHGHLDMLDHAPHQHDEVRSDDAEVTSDDIDDLQSQLDDLNDQLDDLQSQQDDRGKDLKGKVAALRKRVESAKAQKKRDDDMASASPGGGIVEGDGGTGAVVLTGHEHEHSHDSGIVHAHDHEHDSPFDHAPHEHADDHERCAGMRKAEKPADGKTRSAAAPVISFPRKKSVQREAVVRFYFPGSQLRQADGQPPVLFGHAAVFNQWTEIDSFYEGRFMERMMPGAFKKTIRENLPNMRCLFQHGFDPQIDQKPLGPIEVLREDETGLYYEVPMLDTSYNRDLIPGLQAGVYGASFRFQVILDDRVDRPARSAANPEGIPEVSVREVSLKEFGPVTFPAYKAATSGVRSLTDWHRTRSLKPEQQQALLAACDPALGTCDINELRSVIGKTTNRTTSTATAQEPAPSGDGAGATHSVDEGRVESKGPRPLVVVTRSGEKKPFRR